MCLILKKVCAGCERERERERSYVAYDTTYRPIAVATTFFFRQKTTEKRAFTPNKK